MANDNKPQQLIGGLIAGKVLDRVLDRALDQVIRSPNIPVERREAPAIKEIVKRELEKEVGAQEIHQSNQEPWYRSRVTWGALGGVLGAVGGVITLYADGQPNSMEDYWPHALVIMGAITTLYGRWAAKKPIGA